METRLCFSMCYHQDIIGVCVQNDNRPRCSNATKWTKENNSSTWTEEDLWNWGCCEWERGEGLTADERVFFFMLPTSSSSCDSCVRKTKMNIHDTIWSQTVTHNGALAHHLVFQLQRVFLHNEGLLLTTGLLQGELFGQTWQPGSQR